MAINWSTLTASKATAGSIANWVNRSDLPTENILIEAQAWVYQTLRVREMRARNAAFTFDAGAQSEPLPADYLDPIQFTPFGQSLPLLYVNEENLDEQRDSSGVLLTGTPSRWSVLGETAYVDCACSEDLGGVLFYYARPADLSSTNETNFLTVKFPSLLRYACMGKAFEHMKDLTGAGGWLQLAAGALEDAKRADDLNRRGQYIPA